MPTGLLPPGPPGKLGLVPGLLPGLPGLFEPLDPELPLPPNSCEIKSEIDPSSKPTPGERRKLAIEEGSVSP